MARIHIVYVIKQAVVALNELNVLQAGNLFYEPLLGK